MQQSFSPWIFCYFLPLVFIGAFFLLNLTLAVINSKFTEAHKEQQNLEIENKTQTQNNQHVDNELDNAIA